MEERKHVLNGVLNDIDDTCEFILAAIIISEGIGFNQLHKKIKNHPNRYYKTMAKTTLSKHIKHLLKKKLIESIPQRNSRLKIKPSKYQTSPYFKELSKGFIAQSTKPEDYLAIMKPHNVTSITTDLMNKIVNDMAECVKTMIELPENIAIYNLHQTFYNFETMLRAYRQRIQKNEETTALETINGWIRNHQPKLPLPQR